MVASLWLAGCGRQVTPNPSMPDLDGRMVIQFSTQGTMNFSAYNYVIVFNTCGLNGEPYPNAFNTSFYNYSYAFVLGAQTNGQFTALPTLYQYLTVAGTTNLNPEAVTIGPTTVNAIYPFGQSNTFQITFLLTQLNDPAGAHPACPPGGGPSPTPAPSNPPGPGPTATPNYNVSTWWINFFVVNSAGVVQDSLGGPTDSSQFQFSLNVTQGGQFPLNRFAGAAGPSDPAAFITGGQVNNYVSNSSTPAPTLTLTPTPSPS
jgi:hypothetical protein